MASPEEREPVTKAVMPVAGLGTRFLPATKAMPKEMLPVVDKPAIQYVVEEAVGAGLTNILMVTGRGKRPLEDHFDRNTELEEALAAKGDDERLARVRESSGLAWVHYVRQGEPKGLGHAVLCARQHVGDAAFAVLLGDDLIDPRTPLLPRMLEVQRAHGGYVIALMEVPADQIHLYGCAAVEAGPDPDDGDLVRVVDLVEKPDLAAAPSRLAIIGRYVLDPAIFPVLTRTAPGQGGEIQLTDALRTVVAGQGGPVHAVVFRGRRFDTGDRLAYLQSVIQLACEREDLGPALVPWLRDYLAGYGSRS